MTDDPTPAGSTQGWRFPPPNATLASVSARGDAASPLNGRNYQNLLVLRPGVVMRPGGGTLTTSTNGLRPEDNNYFIEGLDNDEPFTGLSIVNSTLPSGDAATVCSIRRMRYFDIVSVRPELLIVLTETIPQEGIKGLSMNF